MNTFLLHIIKLINVFIPDTRFFRFRKVMYNLAGAKLGNNVRICSSARLLGNGSLVIGDNTWIGPEVLIVSSSSIKIGANVDIAPRVYIGTGTHKIDYEGLHSAGEGISLDININDGVWIGTNVIILPGVEIGMKAIIAAGAVVKSNVVARTIVGGVPAKFIKAI